MRIHGSPGNKYGLKRLVITIYGVRFTLHALFFGTMGLLASRHLPETTTSSSQSQVRQPGAVKQMHTMDHRWSTAHFDGFMEKHFVRSTGGLKSSDALRARNASVTPTQGGLVPADVVRAAYSRHLEAEGYPSMDIGVDTLRRLMEVRYPKHGIVMGRAP
jgi:hypothetical protein